jgi:hypothetical protein
MIARTVAIDELVLRVPGIERAQGKNLAEKVAEILSRELVQVAKLPEGVSLRIRLRSELLGSDLAESIAEQILEGLR